VKPLAAIGNAWPAWVSSWGLKSSVIACTCWNRGAVSTQQSPEICEYPDSGKYAVMDDFKVDAQGNASGFVAVARQADGVDYWDGE